MKKIAFSATALMDMAIGGLVQSALAHSGKPLGYGPLHTKPKPYRTIYRLNRSRKWAQVQSYGQARAIAPDPAPAVR